MTTIRSLSVSLNARTEKFDNAMKKAEATTMSFSKGVSRAAQQAGRGLQAASGAMGAVTAAAASADRSWLALGNTLLASFAAGGPIGAAIALVGSGIGVVMSKTGQMEDEWAKAMKAMAADTAKLEEGLRSLEDQLAGFGKSKLQHELDKTLAEIEARTLKPTDISQDKTAAAQGRQRIKELEKRADILRKEIAIEERLRKLREAPMLGPAPPPQLDLDALTGRAWVNDALSRAPGGVPHGPKPPPPLDFSSITDRLFREPPAGPMLGPEPPAALDFDRFLDGMREKAEAQERAASKAFEASREAIEAQLRLVDGFAAQSSGILLGSLSDGIADGIFNGFKRGEEILVGFGQAITRTVIDAFLEATAGAASRNLFRSVFANIIGGGSNLAST